MFKMKTTLLLFCLFVYFHQLEAAYYPIAPCANNTGRSSTGCSSKCVKYEPHTTHGRKSYYCRDLHCEFEFNLYNFSWTFDEQHCPGLKKAKISVVILRNGETEHRFIEGCCDISLSQKSCTPRECLHGSGGTLYYFVKKEDLCVKYLRKNTPMCKNICAQHAGSTDLMSCNPNRDSETDQSFEPICATNAEDEKIFLERGGANCIKYDPKTESFVFSNLTRLQGTSKNGYIFSRRISKWKSVPNMTCLFYLKQERVFQLESDRKFSVYDVLFDRKVYEIDYAHLREDEQGCIVQHFSKLESYFDMTSPNNDYICMKHWLGRQKYFICMEPNVHERSGKPTEVSGHLQVWILPVLSSVVGIIFLSFVAYFAFPRCALQLKLFKEAKSIDPVTQKMFSLTEQKQKFCDINEKETFENDFEGVSFMPPQVKERKKQKQIKDHFPHDVYDASNASQNESPFSPTIGYLTKLDMMASDKEDTISLPDTRMFVDSGITSGGDISTGSCEDRVSMFTTSSPNTTRSPDSGIPGEDTKFNFDHPASLDLLIGGHICSESKDTARENITKRQTTLPLIDTAPPCSSKWTYPLEETDKPMQCATMQVSKQANFVQCVPKTGDYLNKF